MLLTATCSRPKVDEICMNLTIEEDNFVLIRGSTSHRSEIIFNVRERKEIRDQYIAKIINIIADALLYIVQYIPAANICIISYKKS